MSISSVLQTSKKIISSKPVGVTSRAIGVAALGSVLYDAHVNGKEKAAVAYEVKSADRFYNNYSQYTRSDKQSATLSKVKKWWLQFQMDNSWPSLFYRAGGYVSGFVGTLCYNIPTIALGVVAATCKNVGKVASALILANGAKSFVYDVMGVGKPKNNTELL